MIKKEKKHVSQDDPMRFFEPNRSKLEEKNYRLALDSFYSGSGGSNFEKLQNFTRHVPTQDIRKFVCRNEIFKKILDIHGSIIDCGIGFGGSLFTWAQLSEVYEPLNHTRNIIGFDTFAGFPKVTQKDENKFSIQSKQGGLTIDSYKDLAEAIKLYNMNRFLPQIEKVKLVRGDVSKTIPKYIGDNPHLVISLLHLDFDIYEPTKVALELFVPRMPKGSVIVFDELNHEMWPGETVATLEFFKTLNRLEIRRFAYGSTLSYAIL